VKGWEPFGVMVLELPPPCRRRNAKKEKKTQAIRRSPSQ